MVVTASVGVDAQPRQVLLEGPVAGSAYVDVSVVDGLGAPLEGVTVTLTGVVNREAVSDSAGRVSFNGLPQGRYDVVGRMTSLAPSVPRVLDLPPFGGTSVAVTLKPFAPTLMSTNACGGFDPSSVRTMASSAHVIVHVKVVDQQTVDGATSPDGIMRPLSTINHVQVFESFNRGRNATSVGSTMAIQQGGGRIDRGDYIDSHKFNDLPPLNIGDEYVLFLVSDQDGAYWIHGSEEGAFLVRNDVVEPLGRGGAASAWRRRPREKFFEALRR